VDNRQAIIRNGLKFMRYDKLLKIRLFLLDLDGTFYLGDKLFPGSLDFLGILEKRNIAFMFLTNNSSRSSEEYAHKIRRLGVDVKKDKIITSGEATAIYLTRKKPGARIYVVGTPALSNEFEIHGFKIVETEPDFAVLGFDTTLTYEKLVKMCNFVRSGVPYIATHSDVNCPTSTGFIPDIGSIIALISASTGRKPDVIVGKPNLPIVQVLVEKTQMPASEMAMVGDRLYTDIALGLVGITTILVLSGETRPEDIPTSEFRPDYVMKNILELSEVIKDLP